MTMIVAKPEGLALSTVLWTCLGGYLSAGGAGAINHYIDRKFDARMARTAARPLVSGRIEPLRGLIFGIALGLASFVQLTSRSTCSPRSSRWAVCSATSSSTPHGSSRGRLRTS